MNLSYTYAGIVENAHDPLKLGRVKVRVAHVYGSTATTGYIGTNDLPWALPAGMPAGGSSRSGGFSHLPANGDKVWVRFLDGEPEKPIWEWGMQSVTDRDTMLLHRYGLDQGGIVGLAVDAANLPVGDPNRAVWTRYGHALEINEGSIIITTSKGYRVVCEDSSLIGTNDGNISIRTPLGNMAKFDDLDNTVKLMVIEDLHFNVGSGVFGISDSFSWSTMTDDFTVDSGNRVKFDSEGDFSVNSARAISMGAATTIDLTAVAAMTLSFATLKLGAAAVEPALLGTQFSLMWEALLLYLSTHTHTSATPGTPTSPPIQPTVIIEPLVEDVLSTTVTVQD